MKGLTLFQALKDMKKARWVRKYNPDQRFSVDVDWYDTEYEYLKALRDDWKVEADPFDECDNYVDVSTYDNFEDYERSVKICLNHLEWVEELSRYKDFDIDPRNYKNEEDYLNALTNKVKEEYDPEDEFYCVDPLDYDSPDEYIYEVMERIRWQEQYDPDYQCAVDPGTFYDEEDYVEAVNEWKDYVASLDAELYAEFDAEEALESDDMTDYRQKVMKQISRKRPNFTEYNQIDTEEIYQEENETEEDKESWEDKHNFYNSFSSVDPTKYDHEKDYLDDLRKQWKEYYDPSDMYDVDPHDYDNEVDYMDAIQNYIKMKMK